MRNNPNNLKLKLISWFIEKAEKYKRTFQLIEKQSRKFESLAPKTLNPDDVKVYLEALDEGTNDPDIKNIAITGAYGSGKSSILRTFEKEYQNKFKFLNVSLASFKVADKEDKDHELNKDEFDQLIELSILQQFFYKVKHDEIPDSRFKRIRNLNKKQLGTVSLGLVVWLFSLGVLLELRFLYPLIERLTCDELMIVKIAVLIFSLAGLFFILIHLLRAFNNSRIRKFNLQDGEVEIAEQSKLNQHLDEIIYFFERTKFDIVIIEDLDRFGNTEIFTKLREINTILNNSEQLNRKRTTPITFIYAVKDDMFNGHDRTKFFDFIIPIIQIVNPSNSNDKLKEKLKSKDGGNKPSPEFIDDISLFINDMRLLINISNEYRIYEKSLSKKLNKDKLLAMIVYKNLRPDDFVKLHNQKGILYSLLDKKRKSKITANRLNEIQLEISDLSKEIDIIREEGLKNKEELNAIYVNAIRDKVVYVNGYQPEGLIINENEVPFSDLISGSFLEELKVDMNLKYYHVHINNGYSRNTSNSNFSFNDIEKEMSSKLNYLDRLALIESKNHRAQEYLEEKKNELEEQQKTIRTWTTKQIFSNSQNLDFLTDLEKEDNLMIFLLRNGYINENYYDYISYFYDVSRTREDNEFLISVKSDIPLDFDFKLTKIENIISKIQLRYFRSDVILNNSLVDYMLSKPSTKNRQKLDELINTIINSKKRGKEFLLPYVTNSQFAEKLVQKLSSAWIKFWEFVETNEEYTIEQKELILKAILRECDTRDIVVLSNNSSLKKYLESHKDFLGFTRDINEHTVMAVIDTLELKIESFNIETTGYMDKQHTKGMLKHVYMNQSYSINKENLTLMLSLYYSKFSSIEFNRRNYSHILESKNEEATQRLWDYIHANINIYLKNVFFNINENNKEDVGAIIKLLNNEDVKIDLKKRLIKSQSIKLDNVSEIKDSQLIVRLFQENKIATNWKNVLYYYSLQEPPVIDQLLIDFLNLNENFEKLSKSKLEIVPDSDSEIISSFSLELLQNKDLSDESYMHIIKSLPEESDAISSLTYDDLSNKKVKSLIDKGFITPSESDFDKLKDKFPNLHIDLVEKNESWFIEAMEEIYLDEEDLSNILSANIPSSTKAKLIEISDESALISNQIIIKKIAEILSEKDYFDLSHQLIQAIFTKSNSNEFRIKILLNNIDTFDIEEIESLVEQLGAKYYDMFKPKKRPQLPLNSHNIELIKMLKEMELIKNFKVDEKGNKIRVTAF